MLDKFRNLLAQWPWWLLAIAVLALVIATFWLSRGMGQMADISLFSDLVSILLIPVAVGCLFISLRLADKLGGIEWTQIREKIGETSVSATVYATGRWIAVAIIISAILR